MRRSHSLPSTVMRCSFIQYCCTKVKDPLKPYWDAHGVFQRPAGSSAKYPGKVISVIILVCVGSWNELANGYAGVCDRKMPPGRNIRYTSFIRLINGFVAEPGNWFLGRCSIKSKAVTKSALSSGNGKFPDERSHDRTFCSGFASRSTPTSLVTAKIFLGFFPEPMSIAVRSLLLDIEFLS